MQIKSNHSETNFAARHSQTRGLNYQVSEGNAYTTSIRTYEESLGDEVFPARIESIAEVLQDARSMRGAERDNARVYRGGNVTMYPDRVYAIMGDTVCVGSEELTVEAVVERGSLLCGAPVCLISVVSPINGYSAEVHVVPEGTVVEHCTSSSMGVYEMNHINTCTMRARIFGFLVDPSAVRRPAGRSEAVNRIVYNWRMMKRQVYNFSHCISSMAYVAKVDRDVLRFLHEQRLETSSGLGTVAVNRVIWSSAIKYAKQIRPDTIKTTVGYFTILGSTGIQAGDPAQCVIQELSSFPALSDPQVAIVSVGHGFFNTSESQAQVNVLNNGLLSVKSSEGATFVDGLLTWNADYSKPSLVHCYGPRAMSSALIYTVKSTHNSSEAFKRMTNSRVDEGVLRCNSDFLLMTILGYPRPSLQIRRISKSLKAFSTWGLHHNSYAAHSRGLTTQMRYELFDTSTMVIDYYNQVSDMMRADGKASMIFAPPFFDRMKAYAEQEHLKKAERMATYAELMDQPFKFDGQLMKQYVSGKVKYETAKNMKLPRQFISLECYRTLYAPQIPELFKQETNQHFTVPFFRGLTVKDCGTIDVRFWKSADQESMDDWAERTLATVGVGPFQRAINQHSDDSHLTFMVEILGVEHVVNVCADLVKCDLSHSPGVFVLLTHVLVACGFDSECVLGLMQQLQTDIKLKHPDPKSTDYIMFQVEYILLMTGSVLTTIVNNVGSLPMLFNIISMCDGKSYSSEQDLVDAIILAGMVGGYEITVDAIVCTPFPLGRLNPHFVVPGVSAEEIVADRQLALADLTFLKHFPVSSESGKPVALKDYATLLRGYGMSEDEPDGETRMREIVQGWNTTYDTSLTDIMFQSLGLSKPFTERVSDDALARRYKVDPQTLRESFELLFSIRKPCLVAHPGLDAVLKVGYGLGRLREGVNLDTVLSGDEAEFLGLGVPTPI